MHVQVGGLMLGGSALFRTNGLTQFGARHLVSRVGGDPFNNIGENEEAVQLPIALWCVYLVHVHLVLKLPFWTQCCDLSAHYYHVNVSSCRSRSPLQGSCYQQASLAMISNNLHAGPGLAMIQPK